MLSQENIAKLKPYAVYQCDPVLEWLPEEKRSLPYWGINWTFILKRDGETYYMEDTCTAWEPFKVVLTDENVGKFKYLFSYSEVHRCEYNWDLYRDEDKFAVPMDSNGMKAPWLYVKMDAQPIRERVMRRIQEQIDYHESEIKKEQENLERIQNDPETDMRFM